MGVISKLQKQRSRTYRINDVDVFVRSITHGQARQLNGISELLQKPFALGCCLLEENGSPVCERRPDESLEDYALRCAEVFSDIDMITMDELIDVVNKASKPADVETLTKN